MSNQSEADSLHSDNGEDSNNDEEGHDCAICKNEVPVDCDSMICDLCELWFHIECIPMTAERYNLLKELGDGEEDIKWFCPSCKVGFKEMKTKINVLEKRVRDLECGMERRINEKITDIVEERMERERRVKNLIFFGIQEAPDDIIGKDRAVFDTNCLKKLGTGISELEIKTSDVESTFRVGKKKSNGYRPLCVRFTSTSIKARLLRNGKMLRNSTDKQKKKAYIAPDLTRTQRADSKRLYDELKRRRDNDEDVIIKFGKIVPRPQEPAQLPARRISADRAGDNRGETRAKQMRKGKQNAPEKRTTRKTKGKNAENM